MPDITTMIWWFGVVVGSVSYALLVTVTMVAVVGWALDAFKGKTK